LKTRSKFKIKLVSTNYERSPQRAEAITLPDSGDLEPSSATQVTINSLIETVATKLADEPTGELTHVNAITLAQLSPGARLVLRCRKDWRAASVSAVTPDCIVLIVASPTGHTYRVRRPHDSLLTFDGAIPVLSDRDPSGWRVALARYDVRW
jgi:hypothetical protein